MNESLRRSFQAQDRIRQLELPESLQARDVRVWLVCLEQRADSASALWPVLAPDERDRANRFLVEDARRKFILTRAALRMILGHCTGVNPAELCFVYNDKGKPSLPLGGDTVETCFNVSHSADVALIAVARGVPVGVDIELCQDRSGLLDIARACLCPAEQGVLSAAAPDDRGRVFYQLWTRKEAVLKASGQGIASGLRLPDVSAGLLEVSGSRAFSVALNSTQWLVQDLAPAAGFLGAVAVEA